jgi:hypothetical protein
MRDVDIVLEVRDSRAPFSCRFDLPLNSALYVSLFAMQERGVGVCSRPPPLHPHHSLQQIRPCAPFVVPEIVSNRSI